MKQNKYVLSTRNRNTLRFMRKEKKFSADDISIQIGKSQAWLGQVERGKLQSIKKDDLIKLLSIYTGYSEIEVLNYSVLENFVSTGYAEKTEPEIIKMKIKSCDECLCLFNSSPICKFNGVLIRKMTFKENSKFPNECPLNNGIPIQIEMDK